MFDPGGTPADWIAKDGKPSVAGQEMPSYEHEDGKLEIHSFMVCQMSLTHGFMLFGRDYGAIAERFPEGLVPAHPQEGAWHKWRPRVYQRNVQGGWTYLGSQHELSWRFGLHHTIVAGIKERLKGLLETAIERFGEEGGREVLGEEQWNHLASECERLERAVVPEDAKHGLDMTMFEAQDKADALLLETLTPFQRLELAAADSFRVRGARTGNLYRIEFGNGFAIIDPLTGETTVSYCLHPEGWMPHADVALATKLALEDETMEVELLENARATQRGEPVWPQWALDRVRPCVAMEKELIS